MPYFAMELLVLVNVVLRGHFRVLVDMGHKPAPYRCIAPGHHHSVDPPIDGDTLEPRLQAPVVDFFTEAIMPFISPAPSRERLTRALLPG